MFSPLFRRFIESSSVRSSGGVELIAKDGKIRVVNTLESRLDLLSRQVRPTSYQLQEVIRNRSNRMNGMNGRWYEA